MAIKTDDLSGEKPFLRVKKTVNLGNDVEDQADFGALWNKEKKVDEAVFQLQGSMGIGGKRFPVFAQINDNPGMSREGNHEKPALRVFVVVDGNTFVEYAVGFKKEKEGVTFYSGETTGKVGGPKASMFFWPIGTVDAPASQEA